MCRSAWVRESTEQHPRIHFSGEIINNWNWMPLSISQRNFRNSLRSISQETIYTYLSEQCGHRISLAKQHGMNWRRIHLVAYMRYLLVVYQQYGQYLTCDAMMVSSSMQYCNRNRNQGNNWIGNKIICTSPHSIRTTNTHAHNFRYSIVHSVSLAFANREYNFQTNRNKNRKKDNTSLRDRQPNVVRISPACEWRGAYTRTPPSIWWDARSSSSRIVQITVKCKNGIVFGVSK